MLGGNVSAAVFKYRVDGTEKYRALRAAATRQPAILYSTFDMVLLPEREKQSSTRVMYPSIPLSIRNTNTA